MKEGDIVYFKSTYKEGESYEPTYHTNQANRPVNEYRFCPGDRYRMKSDLVISDVTSSPAISVGLTKLSVFEYHIVNSLISLFKILFLNKLIRKNFSFVICSGNESIPK